MPPEIPPIGSESPKLSEDASFHGIPVTFQSLNYTVVSNSDKKSKIQLLNGVTGFMRPGQLVALMGPSGCAKTTLLDILAGRKTTGSIQGEVRFAGQRPTKAFLRRYTGYVEQTDTLVPNLTVKEMLMYTCEMKSPVSEGLESKRARVDQAIQALGLQPCSDVLIGGYARRGISGGQLKRANIGIALVVNPQVLFLDEPTTGLDSYTANEVMSLVKGLANRGLTVCATIHSPTPFCFGLFDRLFVMLSGRCVYFGDNGGAILPMLTTAGEVPLAESDLSRAEWLTDVVVRADREGRAAELAERYSAAPLAQTNARQTEELNKESLARVASQGKLQQVTQVRRATETPALLGFWTLVKYRGRADYRDSGFVSMRLADKVLNGLIVLTLYLGIGNDFAVTNTANIVAALFMWITLPGFTAVAYVPAIVLDRALYMRERSDGLYQPHTYYFFKISEEILLALLVSAPVAAAVWFAVQFQGSFAVFWAAYFLTTITGISLGYAVAALSPTLDVANAALPAFVVIMLFFSGNLKRYEDMGWLKWVMWIDFLHWPWGAVMLTQFQNSDAVVVGDYEVLSFFSLRDVVGGPWAYLGIEVAFFFLFCVMGWAALTYIRHTKR